MGQLWNAWKSERSDLGSYRTVDVQNLDAQNPEIVKIQMGFLPIRSVPKTEF